MARGDETETRAGEMLLTGSANPRARLVLTQARRLRHGAAITALLAVPALLAGCSDARAPEAVSAEREPVWRHIEQGDLGAIRQRGVLRLLVRARPELEFLPRGRTAYGSERALVEALGQELGLEVLRVPVETREEMIRYLLRGKGDLAADRVLAGADRDPRVAHTLPVRTIRGRLVTRAADQSVSEPEDLRGRRIAIPGASPFAPAVARLQKAVPGLEIEEVPERGHAEALLFGVATGDYDVAVAEDGWVDVVLAYRSDLRVAFDLDAEVELTGAVRPDATELRKAVNEFLIAALSRGGRRDSYREDLPGLKKRKTLRVLTRNNAATYFMWRGELVGFEYELARKFAKRHRLRLQMVVPPSRADLIPWLLEGRGDLIAASLTPSEERRARGVAFSRPYNYVTETVVARADDGRLAAPEDLAGRTVVVRRSSSYWTTVEAIRKRGIAVKLVAAPEELETEEIIARVATAEYDLTVADSHILDVELGWRDDVKAALPLGEPVSHGWAVRAEDGRLLAAVNAFFKKEYRGTFYNILRKKYFQNRRLIRRQAAARRGNRGISPYDAIVRKYARRYGFDWRLIVAQMYQESRFDPQARSFAGARGLLQVMPRTARELGFTNLERPENGIHAGVRYLAWLRDRLKADLPRADRALFALAAYNAGYGRVFDARRVARRRDWDPDQWFGQVERAIPLLSRRSVAKTTRFGYCRCREVVPYVREITDRFQVYVRKTEG